MNSVYAVIIWKARVIAANILKNEARALCLEIGIIAIPIVTSQRWLIKAMDASLKFPEKATPSMPCCVK